MDRIRGIFIAVICCIKSEKLRKLPYHLTRLLGKRIGYRKNMRQLFAKVAVNLFAAVYPAPAVNVDDNRQRLSRVFRIAYIKHMRTLTA